ncbi:MAG: hypothetical protein ACI4ET_01275 [Bilifractor sp.]
MIPENGWMILSIVLLVNLLLSCIYLFWNVFRKKQRKNGCVLRFTVMVLCPVAGILYFFVGWICFRIFFHRQVNLEDVIFSKKRVDTYVKAEEKAESNLVPLEEAIAITDQKSTRELMMEVAKRDVSHTLSTIVHTLDSEDSEVAHYGASVLQGALSDFHNAVQKLEDLIDQDEEALSGKEQVDLAALIHNERALIHDLDGILSQHVLSPMEQKDCVGRMEKTAELLEKHTDLQPEEIEHLCGHLLEVQNTELCRKWAGRSMQLYPQSGSSYSNLLQLYYQTGERENFFNTLNLLKTAGVPIDHQTLEKIRVFQSPQEG